MNGKRQHQTAYRVVSKQGRNTGKAFYWQKQAAYDKAKEAGGVVLHLDGYWRPEDEPGDVVYQVISDGGESGIFTDKGRAVEFVKERLELYGEPTDGLTYERLSDDWFNGYWVKGVTLNEFSD